MVWHVRTGRNRALDQNSRQINSLIMSAYDLETAEGRIAALREAVARRLDVPIDAPEELQEVKRDIAPEAVLDEIEETAPGRMDSP